MLGGQVAPGTPHHVGMVRSEEARKRFSEVQSLRQSYESRVEVQP